MAIFKRPDSKYYWASIKLPTGGRIRQSTGTTSKKDAEAWVRQYEADLWRRTRLGDKKDGHWEEAVVRWITERSDKKTLDDDKCVLRYLHPILHGVSLSKITPDILANIAVKKKQEGVSNRTVNQHINLIRAIMRRAKNVWGWSNDVPAYQSLPEPRRRIRFLTQAEAQVLLDALPQHQKDIVLFAIMTGLRQSNVTGLTWNQVSIERRVAWIYGDQAKCGEDIAVPLNDTAIEILKRQKGNHMTHVFTYKNQPVKRVNGRSWRKALKRAGIENFRWHDLRHTFASWLAMNVASLVELQELGGWSSPEMVRRYAHLSASHLREITKKLDTFLSRSGKNGTLKCAVSD